MADAGIGQVRGEGRVLLNDLRELIELPSDRLRLVLFAGQVQERLGVCERRRAVMGGLHLISTGLSPVSNDVRHGPDARATTRHSTFEVAASFRSQARADLRRSNSAAGSFPQS